MHILSPSSKELREAREEFVSLIQTSAAETDFQSLLARCPCVLSRALPLRLEPKDIQPLARVGQSDPDFIFYPRTTNSLGSFGIIELKRPDTTLITVPRKDVVLLSRDAATAVAQAQHYCRSLRTELMSPLTSNLIIGANDYIFVIAGLTDELTRKLTPSMLRETIDSLLPARCQIIPYDELLRRFESSLQPSVFYFRPLSSPNLRGLEELAKSAMSGYKNRWQLNEENMDFWSAIEDRWRASKYIGTAIPRIIDRSYWCVTGTDYLATESPSNYIFPSYVKELAEVIDTSLLLHRLLVQVQAQAVSTGLEGLQRILAPSAWSKLEEAIQRCRASKSSITWMDTMDTDVDLLARLGLIAFYNLDSGEQYYHIDPLLLKIWPERA